MKLDLHVHTHHSQYGGWKHDAVGSPEKVIEAAMEKGLDGIAITDHDTMKGAWKAMDIAEDLDFIVIPGIEVSSRDGHILALDVEDGIEKGLPAEETVERIRDAGGTAVAAHPFAGRGRNSLGAAHLELFDGIETLNSRTSRDGNRRAEEEAETRGLPTTGGSDAHHPDDVGLAYTVLPEGKLDLTGAEVEGGQMDIWRYGRLYMAKIVKNF